ncbi:MAG: hypothetical protein ACRDPW_06125 [Mycobacteriales bacterium]
MALTHIADTSVLTRLPVPAVRNVLRDLLVRRRIGRCTVSDLELGFSARTAAEWDQIHAAVTLFAQLDIQAEDFTQAGTVQQALADRGYVAESCQTCSWPQSRPETISPWCTTTETLNSSLK